MYGQPAYDQPMYGQPIGLVTFFRRRRAKSCGAFGGPPMAGPPPGPGLPTLLPPPPGDTPGGPMPL